MGVTYVRFVVKYAPYLNAPLTQPSKEETLSFNPFLDCPADNEYLDETLARYYLHIDPDQIRDITIRED